MPACWPQDLSGQNLWRHIVGVFGGGQDADEINLKPRTLHGFVDVHLAPLWLGLGQVTCPEEQRNLSSLRPHYGRWVGPPARPTMTIILEYGIG